MTAVQDQINALLAKVKSENTVIGSALTLITGLKNQLDALQATTAPPNGVDPVALQALSDAIDAGAAQLAAAVAMSAAPTPAQIVVTAGSTAATAPSTAATVVPSTVASSS